MIRVPLSRCLIFCRRAVSVTIIFSSLACYSMGVFAPLNAYAANPASGAITMSPEALAATINAGINGARAAGIEAYHITSILTQTTPTKNIATIKPGTYTGIEVDPQITATPIIAQIGKGTVTLSGAPHVELLPSQVQEIVLDTGSTLVLEQGDLTGGISFPKNSRGQLLINGQPGNQVLINGKVLATNPGRSVLTVNGANLVVDGAIGDRSGPLGTIEVKNGDVTVMSNYPIDANDDRLGAGTLTIHDGKNVTVDGGVRALRLNLGNGATLQGTALYNNGAPNRIEIGIDNAAPGATITMAEGSSIINQNEDIFLINGVKGAGTIQGFSIAAHQGYLPSKHFMINSLIQSNGSLTILAKQDIAASEINADTIEAGLGGLKTVPGAQIPREGGLVLAGVILKDYAGAPNEKIYPVSPTAQHIQRSEYAPAYPVTTHKIEALKGGVYAGELNLSGKGSSLSAQNLLLVKNSGDVKAGGVEIPKSSGDLDIPDGTFTLTGSPLPKPGKGSRVIPYAAQIDGNMTVGANGNSSFTTLNVGTDEAIKADASASGNARITGGTLTGNRDPQNNPSLFRAANETFTDISSINIVGTLEATNELTISNNQVANVTHTRAGKATINGAAGSSYNGTDFFASDSADFTNVTLNLKGEPASDAGANLKVTNDLTMTGNGASQIDTTSVGGSATISGGSYSGASFTADSASFTGVTGVTMSDALKVKRDLTLRGTGASSIKIAAIGGTATISGGSYSGDSMTAASASFTDVTNLNLGAGLTTTGDATLTNVTGAINGVSRIGRDFTASDSSVNVQDMTVTGGISASSGYLTGGEITAGSATFSGNSVAEFDDLTLKSDNLSLTIQSGSTVFINNALTDLKGIEALQEGKLIIHGHNDSPTTITEIYIDRQTALAQERGIFNLTKGLFGGDENGAASSANFTQLHAGTIEIANASLTLAGIGAFKNTVANDLIIHTNIDSSLGDITVGGNAMIDGGKLKARNFNVAGNANFEAVSLNLLGAGDNASSVNGNLTVTRNAQSSLGDIKVGGEAAISGGTLAAGQLEAGAATLSGEINATIDSITISDASGSLNVGAKGEGSSNLHTGAIDTNGAPINIFGDSSIQIDESGPNTGQLNSGPVNIQGGFLTATRDITIESVSIGESGGDLAGANVTISKPVTGMKGGSITATEGTVTLKGGAQEAQGAIVANENIVAGSGNKYRDITGSVALEAGKNIDAQNIRVDKIEAGGNVTAHHGSINLASASEIGGNLVASNNTESSLGVVKVGASTEIASGRLSADSLTTGSASFRNGLNANLREMILESPDGASGTFNIGSSDDSKGNTNVSIKNLSLNGAAINVGNVPFPTAPAVLAVKNIGQNGNQINGHIGVGQNGRLALGDDNYAFRRNAAAIFALAQPVRLNAGYGIHVTGEGAASPAPNQIQFDANSLFIIDAGSRRQTVAYAYLGNVIPTKDLSVANGAVGALSAEQATVQATINNGSKIYIRNPVANTVIVALGVNINTSYQDKAGAASARAGDNAPWTGANLDYDNKDKVRITRLEDEYAGQFLVEPINAPSPKPDTPQKPEPTPPSPTPPAPGKPDQPSTPHPSTTHPDAHPGIQHVVQHGVTGGTIGTEPHHLVKHHGAGFISHTLAHGNPAEATHLVEGSSRAIILGAVPQLSLAANSAAQAAAQQRTSLVTLLTEEDIYARNITLWAVPLYRSTNGWSLEAGSHDYDYSGGIGGIAVGGDITFGEKLRAGLAFNIGGGYSKSSGDLPETTNNMTFWGLGAYAGWAFGNFGLAADVNFTSSFNRLKQDVTQLNGWSDLKTDAQAYVLAAGLGLEYQFETSFMDITPHAGFKYHYLHVDDYDLTHNGNTIINGDSFDQNIWTFPIGVKFSNALKLDNGWLLSPALDFRITHAAGDIQAKTTTRYTNTAQDIELRSTIMDYLTVGGTAGLEASYGDFTVGVNYSLDAGSHTLYNTVMGTFRYEF